MADDSNGTSIAAKLGIAASVIAILGFLGFANWHDVATKFLHVDDGTPGASDAQPPGSSLFPASFSYGARTFTATDRVDEWTKGGCETCVASIGALYTADDNPKLRASAEVTLEADGKAAEAAAQSYARLSKGTSFAASSGRYLVTVTAINFDLNVSAESFNGYAVASTLGKQTLGALAGG